MPLFYLPVVLRVYLPVVLLGTWSGRGRPYMIQGSTQQFQEPNKYRQRDEEEENPLDIDHV